MQAWQAGEYQDHTQGTAAAVINKAEGGQEEKRGQGQQQSIGGRAAVALFLSNVLIRCSLGFEKMRQ